MLAVAVASIVVTIAVAGGALVFSFERQVLRYVEQNLNLHWTELAAAFEIGTDGDPSLIQRMTDPRYQQPYGGAYWQISENGRPVLRSRSLFDKELPRAESQDGAQPQAAYEAEGPDGSEVYVVVREVTLDGLSGTRVFELAVAVDHNQVVVLREAFGWDVTRVLVPIAAVLMLFAWLQIWLGLRPLRTVGQELNAVQSGKIRRMPEHFPREIAPLVESINKLLDRQENLIRKARDRAGALAHGLKTPLTILTGEVRRLEMKGLSDEGERIKEQLLSIGDHVDREVARARMSGASVGGGAYTAVNETVTRLLRLMYRMPRGDRLNWQTRIPPDLGVDMDPHDFGEVMGNLLDNARKWAASRVMIQVDLVGDKARLSIQDDGPGFSDGSNKGLPERGMTGRSDTTSSGLGLGIVEDILAEYGTKPEISGEGECCVTFEVKTCRPSPMGANDDARKTSTTRYIEGLR
ncbi:ATP-binding protein [Microvirga antarctica]|uniref:ATP-binding protein n=1 Tax=Microvirga antarctica TaxID=2819233 RepID=UPI001B3010D4